MHDDHLTIEGRLRRVVAERLRPAMSTTIAALEVSAWHVGDGLGEPVPPATAIPEAGGGAEAAARYVPFPIRGTWGPAWGTSWFHVTGVVPECASGSAVEVEIDLGWNGRDPGMQAEGLVYRPDGSPVKALNPFNNWVPVEGGPGSRIDFYIEAGANPNFFDGRPYFQPTAEGDKATSSHTPIASFDRADVVVRDEELVGLVIDLEVLDELQATLPLGEPRRWKILRALERSLDRVDLRQPRRSAAAARAELREVLDSPAVPSAHTISAIGHAHIDSAWLWPTRETVRKVARTASNVVDLLDRYPEFVFAMSSAQQYAWLKELRPEVFARVKQAVAEGRFVPVGGMWVESDTNMVGSEAMVRQFTQGQRFFQDEFGVRAQEVWLPDSFGYSAALPQIVRQAGLRWFLTQKISWNQTNRFPHHTFWWEGIDGTRVFTHFPPADTYSGDMSGAVLAHAVTNFREKGRADHSLLPFGFGDGGGGPTREMLERAARVRDLEGSPKVVIRSPREFFADAEAGYPDAPVWKGELYLELHRGTLTSQAVVKQGNRQSEHLFHEAEAWSAAADVAGLVPYPYDEFDRLWQMLLLHQFHDVLPGTSIAWVHAETRAAHAEIARRLGEITMAAQRALAGQGQLELVFNAAPDHRDGVPAYGAAVAAPQQNGVTVEREGCDTVLTSSTLIMRVDGRGLITSVIERASGRETVPPGTAMGALQLHSDFPIEWDAWDIDEFYRNTVEDLVTVCSLEISSDQSRPTVRVTRAFGDSTVTQLIALAADAPRIEFETRVDWREQEKVLKVAFPIDVHADHAAFETQFGHVVRPTHENTTWDAARFEVSAHRWVHVGEPGFGVAVVNDSTYGHEVTRSAAAAGGSFSTVRLSLLRGPLFPDPHTDQGEHDFRYSVVVGAGIGDAVREGAALNLPPRHVSGAHPVEPLVRVEGGAVLETVKLADDRSGDIVVRLYEPLGARAGARVRFSSEVESAWPTDLLEERVGDDLAAEPDGAFATGLRSFQIVTLRARRATA